MPLRQPPERKRTNRISEIAHLDGVRDPLLSIDRQYTLALMHQVERMRADGASYPPAADPSRELQQLLDNLLCPNCMNAHRRANIFCGDQCTQEAQAVRHIRKCVADGRIAKPDCQEGIGQKLIQIISGGYPSERQLTSKLRNQVLERDKRICQICRMSGNEIDHIEGSSNDPTNLRVLCASCNRRRVLQAMRPTTTDDAIYMQGIFSRLALRIAAPEPVRLCDRDDWERTWGFVKSERRRTLREIEEIEDSEFEDVDGYLAHAMDEDD